MRRGRWGRMAELLDCRGRFVAEWPDPAGARVVPRPPLAVTRETTGDLARMNWDMAFALHPLPPAAGDGAPTWVAFPAADGAAELMVPESPAIGGDSFFFFHPVISRRLRVCDGSDGCRTGRIRS